MYVLCENDGAHSHLLCLHNLGLITLIDVLVYLYTTNNRLKGKLMELWILFIILLKFYRSLIKFNWIVLIIERFGCCFSFLFRFVCACASVWTRAWRHPNICENFRGETQFMNELNSLVSWLHYHSVMGQANNRLQNGLIYMVFFFFFFSVIILFSILHELRLKSSRLSTQSS